MACTNCQHKRTNHRKLEDGRFICMIARCKCDKYNPAPTKKRYVRIEDHKYRV